MANKNIKLKNNFGEYLFPQTFIGNILNADGSRYDLAKELLNIDAPSIDNSEEVISIALTYARFKLGEPFMEEVTIEDAPKLLDILKSVPTHNILQSFKIKMTDLGQESDLIQVVLSNRQIKSDNVNYNINYNINMLVSLYGVGSFKIELFLSYSSFNKSLGATVVASPIFNLSNNKILSIDNFEQPLNNADLSKLVATEGLMTICNNNKYYIPTGLYDNLYYSFIYFNYNKNSLSQQFDDGKSNSIYILHIYKRDGSITNEKLSAKFLQKAGLIKAGPGISISDDGIISSGSGGSGGVLTEVCVQGGPEASFTIADKKVLDSPIVHLEIFYEYGTGPILPGTAVCDLNVLHGGRTTIQINNKPVTFNVSTTNITSDPIIVSFVLPEEWSYRGFKYCYYSRSSN